MDPNYLKCKQKIKKKSRKTPQEIILKISKTNENNKNYQKDVKKICSIDDLYTECVKDRRPLNIIRKNAIIREEAIKARRQFDETIHNAFHKEENLKEKYSLFELGDLETKNDGLVELNESTPVCSEISLNLKDKVRT